MKVVELIREGHIADSRAVILGLKVPDFLDALPHAPGVGGIVEIILYPLSVFAFSGFYTLFF